MRMGLSFVSAMNRPVDYEPHLSSYFIWCVTCRVKKYFSCLALVYKPTMNQGRFEMKSYNHLKANLEAI